MSGLLRNDEDLHTTGYEILMIKELSRKFNFTYQWQYVKRNRTELLQKMVNKVR